MTKVAEAVGRELSAEEVKQIRQATRQAAALVRREEWELAEHAYKNREPGLGEVV